MGRIEDMYMVEIAININNEITFDKKKRGVFPNPYRHKTQYIESKRVSFHILWLYEKRSQLIGCRTMAVLHTWLEEALI